MSFIEIRRLATHSISFAAIIMALRSTAATASQLRNPVNFGISAFPTNSNKRSKYVPSITERC